MLSYHQKGIGFYSCVPLQCQITWHNSSWRLLSLLLKISQNSNSFRHSYQGTSYFNKMSKTNSSQYQIYLSLDIELFEFQNTWDAFFFRIIKDLNHILIIFDETKKAEWNFPIIEFSLSVNDFMTSSRTWTQLYCF